MFTRIFFTLLAAMALFTAAAQTGQAKPDSTSARPPLETYTGTYSSPDFPLQIEVQVEKGALQAQATGQPAFTLEATGSHSFRFAPAGIVMVFVPEKKQLTLQQKGRTFVFTR
ncbi:MAG: DUF3471 domain-containing protein [Chitinophagaceae bacterium]|nr:MAG: DUF3471 domain-containing protein [Chitinophagaceae bacterium]